MPPVSTEVELSKALVLNCSSRGEPVPRIVWRFRAAGAAHFLELDAKGVDRRGRLSVARVVNAWSIVSGTKTKFCY